ncbi:MAG TPA: FAD-dependent oxidoreductase [Nocardioidaceae bacterium]|nr:FAD-dependent oxidoreductase [Nocardioidaceae bacterium]
MSAERKFVVVGGGLAGAKAVETLRAEGFAGPVHLVGAERWRPYERPPLSKDYLAGSVAQESIFVHGPDWYADQRVQMHLGSPAARLDTATHTVVLESGERVGYDRLLLATGSRARVLSLPGASLAGVHYLRTLDDSDGLRAALRAGGRRVVVIGAGWIGLEVAAAARGWDNDVAVVEPQPVPLRAALGDELGAVFAGLHREHGVDLRLGTGVAELTGDRHVTGVRTGAGDVLPADVVVVGVGAIPNTELAARAGLSTGNGVLVDASMRTSDPAVWAAGDVANAFHPVLGRQLRVEHWDNAIRTGEVAARSMLGQDVRHDSLPYFFTDQYDLGMEFTGYVDPGVEHQIVYRGDPATREFVAFWMHDGRTVAGMNVNVWDVADEIRGLIESGAPVTTG